MDDQKFPVPEPSSNGFSSSTREAAVDTEMKDWAGITESTTTGVDSGQAQDVVRAKPVLAVAMREASSGPGPGLSSDSSDTEDEETYPEGGTQAWLAVLGCWLSLFSALGIMNILATFQTYLAQHQLVDYDAGTIGWIFSVYTFLCFFLGIYIGPIFDKYGPRWLIFGGTLCLGVSMMLFSISTEYWQFLLAFGVLSGLASSLLFTPSIATIGHYFKKRRGLATGIASTGGSLGGVVFPLILQQLFPRVGWPWAIRTLGFVCLVLTALSNFLIRSRLPPAKNASTHPDPRIFRNPAFAWTTAATFMLEFALFVPLTYISGYALSKGFSESFAFSLLTILNAGSVVGRILPGWWADRVGAFNANIASVAVTVVACLGIWLPAGRTTAGIVVFALLFGFCSGCNISLVPVAIGRLCKTQHYGRYYATCYTVVSAAVLVGIPIAGKVITADGGRYEGLVVMTGVFYCGALAAFYAAKVSAVGWSFNAIF